MRELDLAAYAFGALRSGRLRSTLILLAMAIGVAGVVMLTWVGDAARLFVTGEFSALGSDLVIVLPGRSETTGGTPPVMGETPRDLTLADAQSLYRLSSVRRVAPVVVGNAPVARGRFDREATILGTSPEMFAIRHLTFGAGRPWSGDWDQAQPVCVLGATLHAELFGSARAVGEQVRIGDRRFRVVGTLASEGRSLGLDLDDIVLVPVASAQALFDAASLFRILIGARDRDAVARAERDVAKTIAARHDGEEDVTVITQEALLGTFDRILSVLTWTIGGIASISLLVAGILVMNVMVVSVSQRREEIGLLKALGATQREIRNLFLTEAVMVSVLGATIGLVLGQLATLGVCRVYPELQPGAPWWAAALALTVALGCGLVFGVAPARRAARLMPVEALSRR